MASARLTAALPAEIIGDRSRTVSALLSSTASSSPSSRASTGPLRAASEGHEHQSQARGRRSRKAHAGQATPARWTKAQCERSSRLPGRTSTEGAAHETAAQGSPPVLLASVLLVASFPPWPGTCRSSPRLPARGVRGPPRRGVRRHRQAGDRACKGRPAGGYTRFRQTNELYYLSGIEVRTPISSRRREAPRRGLPAPRKQARGEVGGQAAGRRGVDWCNGSAASRTSRHRDVAEHLAKAARGGPSRRCSRPKGPPRVRHQPRLALRAVADAGQRPWDARASREGGFVDLLAALPALPPSRT